ncbi:MAG: hypothetical protein GY816_22595 [Cytophagales bacterium]|nr:hypothetical protein [Cytophagales bacterium]
MNRFLIIILLFSSFSSLASGWPKKKGTGYYKLGYSMINGMHFFDESGTKTRLGRDLGFYTLSLYGEYGLTDHLTLVTYLPFATTAKLGTQFGEPDGSITTFGDINVGFRFGLVVDKPNVLSMSATFGLPTGTTSTDTSGGEASLQTGDGEFNQLIKIESGHSFENGFYASSLLGVNFRSKGFSEEIQFGGEIGHVNDVLISILKFQSINSLRNGDNTESTNSNIFNNNMELLTIAPELALKFSDKFGISVNHTIYLSGKKTLASPNTTLGIFWNL